MFTYKQIFKQEFSYYTLEGLKSILTKVVPAGTKDEDVLLEIEKDIYTGYYDDYIVDTHLVISLKTEIAEPKKTKKTKKVTKELK